jgi:hypothetical protein
VRSDSSGEWWPSVDPTFAGWGYDDLWAELEDVNDIIRWWELERDEHPERVARYMARLEVRKLESYAARVVRTLLRRYPRKVVGTGWPQDQLMFAAAIPTWDPKRN